jgi:exodeoxyribonuclease VIII
MGIITKKDSNAEYHSHDSMSSSGLKYIWKKSVYHFNRRLPFSSSSLTLGSAVHTALLEPELFYDEYMIMQKFDGRSKEGKQLKKKYDDLAGKMQLLTHQEGEVISGIIANFKKDELAQKYTKGDIELSHYLKFQGIDVRVRPDCINRKEGFISDPKTCRENSPKEFLRDVYKYGYHLQAAFYMDTLQVDKFIFISCETSYPYSIQCYELSPERIEEGRKAYKRALSDWTFYLETGVELGYNGKEVNDEGIIIL